ncbi:PTS lactose/cellobiose transporter subunit IIA [Clostridium isatidis]
MNNINMEAIAFKLISNVGEAKSLLMEALELARNDNFEAADDKIKEANKFLSEGHHSHFSLIQKEADGEQLPFSLILMHAEDQLMTTESLKLLVEELIFMYKKHSK